MNFSSEQETERAKAELGKSKRPDYFLKQLGAHRMVYKNFCTDMYSLSVYYEYLDKSLGSCIDELRRKRAHFSESEVRRLMHGIADCLRDQHAGGHFFYGLTAAHVLIGKNFRVKLLDRALGETFRRDPVEDMLAINGYTDPEVLKCMLFKKTQMSHFDPFKADIWAAGLILWEAVTLERAKSVYDYRAQTINSDKLQAQLQLAQKHYSQATLSVIEKMLRTDYSDRVSATELHYFVNNK